MRQKKFRFFALAALLSFLGNSSALYAGQKDNFFYTVDAELLGGYSKIEGRDGEFSSIDKWSVSPSLKLNDKLYWINLYNGGYNRSSQVVAQEEGGRRTNTTQNHAVTTSFKYFLNETWSLRPLFFANWVFVNETEDEDFGEGLYDYEELGGGLESQWITQKTSDREDEVRLGFRYLNRQYPNYRSLISLFDPNGATETDEKDLNGYKANLLYHSRTRQDWSWGLEGIFFFKDYTDKKTINSNGIRTTDERDDYVSYLNAHMSHPIANGWSFRVDGQFSYNESNLDFYDTHNTLSLADDDFVKDYFDYFSFLVKPALLFTQNWGEEKDLRFILDYAFNVMHYPGRKSQNVSGRYQSDDQEDFTHTVSGKLSVPVTPNLSWVSFGSYTVADSNQDFEAFYLYNYDLWTAVTGVSLKF